MLVGKIQNKADNAVYVGVVVKASASAVCERRVRC